LQAPFALAATVVLAVVLTLSMERNPPSDGDIPAIKSDKAPAPATEQAAPVRSNAMEARSPDAPASKEAPRPPPAPAKSKPAASTQEGARYALPPAAPAADAAGGADRLGSEQRGAAPASAAETKREAAAPLPLPKPEVWIEEIRKLRRQGQPAEAEYRLREFRAAYPDYPLPEDLR